MSTSFGVVALESRRRLLRPAERARTATARRRTRCRGTSSSLAQRQRPAARPAPAPLPRVSATNTLPSCVVPRRNPVPPPQLARDAPGLDVLHPVEAGLLPGLGHDPMSPERTASIAGSASVSASTYHWSVSHGSITTPERSPIRRLDHAILDRVQAGLPRRAARPPRSRASKRSRPIRSVRDQPVGGLHDPRLRHRAC